MENQLTNSKIAPITKEEFENKIKKVDNKYSVCLNDIFYNGLSLTKAISKYNIPRRTLQWVIRTADMGRYIRLRYGFIAMEFSKGRCLKEIREKAGYSKRIRRNIRDEVSDRIRWKLLVKHNFRCVACGSDAKETKLHIDHIIPVARGGSSSEDNLQVLCNRCNFGKMTDVVQGEIR
jgi:hypothetical protein